MPFENSLAHAFTPISIRAHAPAAGGIYGISNARQWIYIGFADNIQGALMSHLYKPDSVLSRTRPTGFVYELAWPEHYSGRTERLIREYAPVCNRGEADRSSPSSSFTKERY
jgi:hypothetical protein